MIKSKIVTINGKKYDTTTGLPISETLRNNPSRTMHSVTAVHSISQKSQSLYSRATKMPVHLTKASINKISRSMDIARSKSISHFARQLESPTPARKPKQNDIGPVKHPLAASVEKKTLKKGLPPKFVPKTDKQIKEEAIAEALSKPAVKDVKKGFFKRHKKFINIFSVCTVLVIVAAYLTYVNLPNLSVRVAGAQAGINATFPEYHPDGYSVSGPITYADGQVNINFQANTGSFQFVITQKKTNWDSTALQEKVNKETSGAFITNEKNGLTIFTYNGNATWVNGGILYTISGNAPLRSDQILHIATSL